MPEDFIRQSPKTAKRNLSKAEHKKRRRETPESLKRFRKIKKEALLGAGPKRIEAQKAKGKLTARERLSYLLDEGSFQEIGLLVETRSTDFGLKDKGIKGDGVVTGFGKIDGRKVAVFSQDFTQLGGSLGLAHARKITSIMDLALEAKIPVIGILDSGGARIQEGVDSLDGYGEIFYRNTKSSGKIPQISIIVGPCAGGAVYSPALTDFVFMVDGISNMFVTGPDVVKAATGENVDFETLGGSMTHASKSGVCHFVAQSEPDCYRQVKELLTFLPQNNEERPPIAGTKDPTDRQLPLLEKLCGVDPRKPYRVHHIIWWLSDDHKFLEVHHHFAKNIVTGFMKLGGMTIAVIANNPSHMAGALDIDASDKAARFIRFANKFNIPILTLVDVPGYWPGVKQEHAGIIRHGAKLLYAYSEATVPKVTLVLRKAYGGAYIAMSSKYLRGDINFSLPNAEIAVMGPRGAIEILYSKELKKSKPEEIDELKIKLAQEYADKFASPYQTASRGSIDEVIEPLNARNRLINAFELLTNKKKPGTDVTGGNIPL